MNKFNKIFICILLCYLIILSKDNIIKLNTNTILTITTPPIGSAQGLKYIVMSKNEYILFYCF